MGHIIATLLCKIPIKELSFKPFGIRMKLRKSMHLVSLKNKLIVLLSGSATNLVCFLLLCVLSQKLSDLALVHLITAIFNLLPSGTLDGGRILHELLSQKLDARKTEIILDITSIIFSCALFILGFFILSYTGYNISLMVTSAYLFIMVIIRQKKLK